MYKTSKHTFCVINEKKKNFNMKMYICVVMKDVCWKYFKENKKKWFLRNTGDTIVAHRVAYYITLA